MADGGDKLRFELIHSHLLGHVPDKAVEPLEIAGTVVLGAAFFPYLHYMTLGMQYAIGQFKAGVVGASTVIR